MHEWIDKTRQKVHRAAEQVTVQADSLAPPRGHHAQHLLEKAKEKLDKTKVKLPVSPRPSAPRLFQGQEEAELQALLEKWSDPERQQGLVPEKESGRPVWDTSHLGWQDFAKRRCGAFWMGAKAYKGYSKVEEARTKMGEESSEYLALRENFHNEFAKDMRVHTERAKGMYIKFCQEITTKSGVVKDVYIDEFQPLTNSTPESAPEEVLRVMRADLGVPLDEIFADFGLRPIASASIGQVHKARLQSTGELVAVKVQHDGVDRVMMEDLKTLRKLAKMMAALEPNAFDMRPIIQSWEETLPMELDFRQEASATTDASAALAGTTVVVPTVFADLCTKRVLVMRFLHMSPFTTLLDNEFVRETGTDVRSVCNELVDACGVLVFKAGLLHGDPHAGNVSVMRREDGPGVMPVLLDWGMFYKMSEDERLSMCRFYHSLANIDMPGMLDALAAIGMKFKGGVTKSQDFVENFVAVIKMMGQETMSKEERVADTKVRSDAAKVAREKNKGKAGKDATKAATKQVQKFLGKSWGEVTKGLSNKEHSGEDEEEEVIEESADLMNPFRDIPSVVVIFMRMVLMLVGLFCTVEATGLQPLPVLAKHARQALQAASIGKEPFGYKPVSPIVPSASSSRSRLLEFRLQQRLQKLAADGLVVGAQVVVLRGAEMVCDIAFGALSSVDARPVKADTKFPLLDLASGLMALAISRALRRKEGEGSDVAGALNAKVSKYWPAFSSSSVSLAAVLSHTAGAQGCYPEQFGFLDIDEFDKVCAHLEAAGMLPTKDAHTAFLLQPFMLWKLADGIMGGSLKHLGGKGYDGGIEQELAPLGLETAWLANRGRDVHVACACRDLPPLQGEMMNALGEPTTKVSSAEVPRKPRSHQECLIRAVLRNPFTFDPMQSNATTSGSFRAALPLGASARSLGKLFSSKQLWEDLKAVDALSACAMDPTATGWLLTAGACEYTRGGLQLLRLRRSGCCGSCFAGLSSGPDRSPGYGLLSPWGSCVMHFPDLGSDGVTIAITLNDVLRGGKVASKLVTAILNEMGAAPTWTKLPFRVLSDASKLAQSPELAPMLEQMGGASALMAMAQENMDDATWQQRLVLEATRLGKRCAALCAGKPAGR